MYTKWHKASLINNSICGTKVYGVETCRWRVQHCGRFITVVAHDSDCSNTPNSGCYEGSKARSQYVQCMDVKQGSADKERVWSAKQLTLINKSKNTTAEAEACKVNGWETISTLRRLL